VFFEHIGFLESFFFFPPPPDSFFFCPPSLGRHSLPDLFDSNCIDFGCLSEQASNAQGILSFPSFFRGFHFSSHAPPFNHECLISLSNRCILLFLYPFTPHCASQALLLKLFPPVWRLSRSFFPVKFFPHPLRPWVPRPCAVIFF